MNNEAMKRAVKIAGGQVALANLCGVKYQAVQKWVVNGCPPRRVLSVEKSVNGKVTRTELRPDLYPVDDYIA